MRSLILASCGLACGTSLMNGQDRQRSEDAIKPLVVMLDVKIADSDDYGAGIIASVVSNRLYIVTANHVVRKDGKEADSINVGFSWLPGETRPARLLQTYDNQLDLAVILVEKAGELSIPPLPFSQIAFASSLNRGDSVYPMGYPSRQPWSTRAMADAIASVQDGLRFDTNYLVAGYSGGALLTSSWRIAGLVTERNGGQGAAIPIERVKAKLQEWNYQVQWKPGGDGATKPASPSGTTGDSIGGTMAGNTAGDPATPRDGDRRTPEPLRKRAPQTTSACRQGFVWREAFRGDYVCVTPESRSQAAQENADPAHAEPCAAGYVWREAISADHICVLVARRTAVAEENRRAAEEDRASGAIAPGRYEVRLLEIRLLNRNTLNRRIASLGVRLAAAPPDPGFLDVQGVINRVPLFHLQRVTVPYRPAPGESVANIDIQQGEELVLNMRGLTTIVVDGRHGQTHGIRETLHESNHLAVNMAFPDGGGEFIFYFAVIRK